MLVKILRESFLMAVGLIVVTALIATVAQAAPRDLAIGQSTSTARGLGGACFAIDSGDEALPCNPAFTARETEQDFKAEFYFGNDVSYLQDVSTLVAGDGDEGTVRRLFSQTRASEMEANLEAAYRRPTFGIAVAPYRIVYSSMIRNQALPVVNLLAAQERSARVQLAGYAGDDWSWGVQFRGVWRKFIAREFTLTDAAAEGGSSILDPETQNAFYIEPGLLREWTEHEWKPQLSLSLMQTGLVDRKHEAFPASPEFHVGGGIEPPVGIGRWLIGLDAALGSETRGWTDPLRLGTVYDVGMTRLSASVGGSDHAFGFLLRYGRATGGLTYRSRWIENWLGQDEWVRNVSLQLGVDL